MCILMMQSGDACVCVGVCVYVRDGERDKEIKRESFFVKCIY